MTHQIRTGCGKAKSARSEHRPPLPRMEGAMLTLRRRGTLHHTEGSWFSAYWHFSFDDYVDQENTWFGDLRVFNDDTLVPGAVWPMHPHRDIEGITYVAEGSFEHADSRRPVLQADQR